MKSSKVAAHRRTRHNGRQLAHILTSGTSVTTATAHTMRRMSEVADLLMRENILIEGVNGAKLRGRYIGGAFCMTDEKE